MPAFLFATLWRCELNDHDGHTQHRRGLGTLVRDPNKPFLGPEGPGQFLNFGDPNELAEFQALRLSPEGEAALKAVMGVEKIDYYNDWPRWFSQVPYGIRIHPDGTVENWWGPHTP